MYDNLQTGTGVSLYSGTVSIGTWRNPMYGDYVMEIPHVAGRHVRHDEHHEQLLGLRRCRRCVEQRHAACGCRCPLRMEKSFTYLSFVHGRNGIDGVGGPYFVVGDDGFTTLVSSFVHYGVSVNNAFWNGSMVYGDGDGTQYGPLVSIDIAGHEMTHGVTQYTAGLIYNGESGALNESWSDVFGAMLERYLEGEGPNTWLLGEDAYTPLYAGDASRYLDNPHQAANHGYTADDDPDHYSERVHRLC